MNYFEFIDRNRSRDIVLCDMFIPVSDVKSVKVGDQCIVPASDDGFIGLVDVRNKYPILLTVSGKSDTHISFKPYGSVYFSYCYKRNTEE